MLFENYLPTPLLSSISKVLEKVAFEQISDFLSAFRIFTGIITGYQHRFVRNKSTPSAVLQFVEQLYRQLDVSKEWFGLFMDLSKAFDLIDHTLLISKIDQCGLKSKVSDWIRE